MVLDASVAIARAYEKETTAAVRTVFAELASGVTAWVPSLWNLEVANVLTQHARKGQLTFAQRDEFLRELLHYDVQVDAQTSVNAWTATLSLADKHRLTVYDSAYLELAIRLNLRLATLDGDLRKAAQREQVLLLGI